MPANKDNQISFKVEEDYRKRVKEAAEEEDVSVANLSRKLHRAGFILYEKIGLKGMRELIEKIPASPGKTRKRGRANGESS